MADFLVRIAINALALVAAVQLVPGVELDYQENPVGLVGVALIFGVVNSYLRPIVRLLALPVSLFTMGLAALAINAAMLFIVVVVSDQLALGFRLGGWPGGAFGLDTVVAGLLAAVVISVVSTALGLVARGGRLLGLG